jgi:hypothetical protein
MEQKLRHRQPCLPGCAQRDGLAVSPVDRGVDLDNGPPALDSGQKGSPLRDLGQDFDDGDFLAKP